MNIKRKLGLMGASAAMVLGMAGVAIVFGNAAGASLPTSSAGNTVSVAPQVSSDPSVANNDQAWGGFIDSAGDAGTSSAAIGDNVQVLVTSVQTNPDDFAGTGSFTVHYNPAQLSYTGSCDTSVAGEVTCPESGLENATAPQGKSDGFFFTVLESGDISVRATVVVNDESGTPLISASRSFCLTVPAPPVVTPPPPPVVTPPAPPVTLPNVAVTPDVATACAPIEGAYDVGVEVLAGQGVNFTGSGTVTITATGGGEFQGFSPVVTLTKDGKGFDSSEQLVIFPASDAGQSETITASVSWNGAAGLIYPVTITLPTACPAVVTPVTPTTPTTPAAPAAPVVAPTPPASAPVTPAAPVATVVPTGAPQTGFGGAAKSGSNEDLLLAGSGVLGIGLLAALGLFITRRRNIA